jgi:hypothetical protein
LTPQEINRLQGMCLEKCQQIESLSYTIKKFHSEE